MILLSPNPSMPNSGCFMLQAFGFEIINHNLASSTVHCRMHKVVIHSQLPVNDKVYMLYKHSPTQKLSIIDQSICILTPLIYQTSRSQPELEIRSR